jgi:hypothetical protein
MVGNPADSKRAEYMAGMEEEPQMKKSIKILLLLLCVVVLAFGLRIWSAFSPDVYDYKLIHNRDIDNGDPEGNLLFAFVTALRINHPAAYDMIDPSAKPRLDEWMNTHQIQRCKNIPHVTLIQSGTKTGRKVEISCFGYDGRIDFVVDNIVVNDGEVVRWGE